MVERKIYFHTNVWLCWANTEFIFLFQKLPKFYLYRAVVIVIHT